MDRVSTNLVNDNMLYYSLQRQSQMDEANSRMASQNRILDLRDDPASASHATRYQSYMTRLERFSENIETTINIYHTTEGHMQEALTVMQQARELAVQGATGTYAPSDLKAMAQHVDELLSHLVQVANAVDGEGTAVFAGQRTKNVPFRVLEGTVPGGDHSYITKVDYLGDIGRHRTEIAENKYIEMNYPGNDVFWAENQSLIAPRDARDFVAAADSKISVDGVDIQVRQGDNIHALVARINDSTAAVKASIDPVTSGLVIHTSKPHQLWLKDEQGTVLQDLGVLRDANTPPPGNYAKDVSLRGGSAFDMLISLRDNLLAGDHLDVGGGSLAGIDAAISNLLGNLGELGAKTDRLTIAFKRTEKELPDMAARLSTETDVDMTKAITDLKVLELTHEAALAAMARLNKASLMDFLK